MTPALEELGRREADRATEIERKALYPGWLDPPALNEAACNAGLNGGCFCNDFHAAVFWYVCECAHAGRPPHVRRFLDICERERVPYDPEQLWALFDSDITDGQIPHYIDVVMSVAQRRNDVADACRRLGDAFSDDEVEVTVRPRVGRHSRLRRRTVV